MPTKCAVHNCTKPSVSKGLCDTHRKRVARHGTTEQTRPTDWGAKEKHPAYKTWCNLRRHHPLNTDPAWLADFWCFVSAVPPKPKGRASAHRPDKDRFWSANNFYWKEPILSAELRSDKAAYMREWSRKAREANPDYHKSALLKRHYGITLSEYDAMLLSQNGCCAICRKAEANEIRGKVISLAVDHDHATGAVRALLCSACNTALGLFQDDPSLLQAAMDYLRHHLAIPAKAC